MVWDISCLIYVRNVANNLLFMTKITTFLVCFISLEINRRLDKQRISIGLASKILAQIQLIYHVKKINNTCTIGKG